MKVYVLNAVGDEPRYQAELEQILKDYPDAERVDVDITQYAECKGCYACSAWLTGKCIIDDGMTELVNEAFAGDALVWLLPLLGSKGSLPRMQIVMRHAVRKRRAEIAARGEEYQPREIAVKVITEPHDAKVDARYGQWAQEFTMLFLYRPEWHPIGGDGTPKAGPPMPSTGQEED